MVDRLLGRSRDATPAPFPAVPADSADNQAAVWARVQLARNLRRPHTLELIRLMVDGWVELHGDRLFGDDGAMVAGLATIDRHRVAIVGMQKGTDTEENIRRSFGMPHPEGYRKAMRVMEMAERFGLPIVTLIDVPGAHPGAESEERGIADAIARSIALMSRLRTPIVAVITGEGGSGGALALAVADVVIALENATYSVITPEGCASILWRTPEEAPTAARAMRMSAGEQQRLGVVDVVVPEPAGGAHTDHAETARHLRATIVGWLDALVPVPTDQLVEARYRRFRALGPYTETAAPPVPAPERTGLADRLRNLLDINRWASPTGPQPGQGRQRDEPPARDEV